MKMRAAPSRGSDGRSSTVKIRMSSATEDFSHSRKNLFPEFVAHRIDVMAQDDAVVGVAVGQLKLIIELQDELHRIECTGAIGMHCEVRQRLISEKIWYAFQFLKAFDGQRPVKLPEKEKNAGVYGIGRFGRIVQQALVACDLTIAQIKSGRVVIA